jgi:DNA polymerase-3 subunit epsilon
MSNAQLILIDKRNQPIKEYIVAVASSDGLNIKGINVIASPAKGEKALLNATLQIPPLEKLDFNDKKIVDSILDNMVVNGKTMSVDELVKKASDDEAVQKSLTKSVKKLTNKLFDLIAEFTSSEVINLIKERRNDAHFKLKGADKDIKGKKIVCIDIEATDICTKDSADIIQVSICDLEGKELYSQFINPGYDIPENEKHNICTEMVKDSPLLADAWPEFYAILKEADIVLAYSTESDFMYLEKTATKKVMDFELDYNAWLDIAVHAKDLVGALRWQSEKMYWFYKTPKLTVAYEEILNKPFPGDAHDALADAQATAELFKAMLEIGRKSQVMTKKPTPVKNEISNNPFAAAFASAKRKK